MREMAIRVENKNFIEGNGIYLREVRASDVNENYYRWMNDPEVTQYLETRYIPQSMENIRRYVERMEGKTDEIFLAICLKESDQHIGNIKLGPINWIHRFADISLVIGEKEFWGKGLASEAIRLLAKFAFNILNLQKLKAGYYEKNIGSKKAFEKVGFKIEGVLRKQWQIGEKLQDEILLGLLRDEIK
jgi:ribosomal-protein-alanine N-acetyltransferase